MRIAFLGIRGVPASYSGFETCAENIGRQLVERGHEVTVYCRPHHIKYPGDRYLGMRLVKIPTIQNKYLDTIVHSFLCSLHALSRRYDVALYFIAGNSPVTWIPRLVGTRTVLNVDGLDWKREKWPRLARTYIHFAEFLATKLPNTYLTDSISVRSYYQQRYHSTPHYIPYGSEVDRLPPGQTLAQWGLKPRQYVLFVGRLVPENCAHHLVDAFQRVDTGMKCVIVGDAPYAAEYIARLKAHAYGDERIVFTGYQFGDAYRELGSNAYVFVETSGVGGTHPALLEAMGFGNCVVFHATEENRETVSEAGIPYDGEAGGNLRDILQGLIDDPQRVQRHREMAFARAAHYSWDEVTNAYEALFRDLVGKNSRASSE